MAGITYAAITQQLEEEHEHGDHGVLGLVNLAVEVALSGSHGGLDRFGQ
jgi:hypothetical protein